MMRSVGRQLGTVLSALALLGGTGCARGARGADPGPNLALGRPYTLTPAPNYQYCTDPGDAVQLTDGRTAGASLTDPGRVGWSWIKDGPARVVIDLGRTAAIDEVRVSTIGGDALGVHFPAYVLVLVSDDGRVFHAVAADDNLELEQSLAAATSRRPHTFRLPNLRTRGRYVLVALECDTPLVLTDEIEVLGGSHDASAVQFAAENAFAADKLAVLGPALRMRTELRAVARALRRESGAQPPAGVRDALARFQTALNDPRGVYDLPYLIELTQDAYRARGALASSTPLGWSVAAPFVQVGPADALPTPRRQALELAAWRGEYASAAVTLVNHADTERRLHVRVTELRGADGAKWPSDGFALRQGAIVRSRTRGPILDALVRLRAGALHLAAGHTEQLWLTWHDPNCPAGNYEFAVEFADAGAPATTAAVLRVPGAVRVSSLRFPEQPALHAATWAYVHRGHYTRAAPDFALRDLRAHYVDADVLERYDAPGELPLPQRDAQGEIRIAFDGHAAVLAEHATARQLLLALGIGKQAPYWPGLPANSAGAWRAIGTQWLRAWVEVLRRAGFGYDRFALYLDDENIGDAVYEVARFIKTDVDPQIRIFANSRGDAAGAQMRRIAPYVDIWSLPDRPPEYRHPDAEQQLRAKSETWTYAADGPGCANDPHWYYRGQMWRAFARGDTGCGFWVYDDPESAPPPPPGWDDPLGSLGPWRVVYGAADTSMDCAGEPLVPSRRWEAWRAGVADYEYLVQVRQAAAAAHRAGRGAEAAAAEAAVDEALRQVLGRRSDAEVVTTARAALTAALERLRAR
jgi:hypothetical protein